MNIYLSKLNQDHTTNYKSFLEIYYLATHSIEIFTFVPAIIKKVFRKISATLR